MKSKLLQVRKMLLVAVGLLVGASAWAEADIELLHTAAVQGDKNTPGTTLDTETHYYNNWGTSAWVAQAYIGFKWTIPDSEIITSATLTFTSKAGGSNNNRTIDVYYKDGTNFDYNNLTLISESNAGTKVGSTADPLTEGIKTFDVTDAVYTLISQGSSEIVFVLGGAAAGGTLYGKGSADKAPKLTITTADAATTTIYTIEFEDESGVTLKNLVRNYGATIGTKVKASEEYVASFKNADGTKKYILASGNDEIELQKDVESNVITLVFREAAKVSYVAKATSNDAAVDREIVKGEDFEGETFKIVYPKYLNVDGTLYTRGAESDNNREFSRTVTLPSNTQNETYTFEYAKSDITNVAYFSEGEEIEGANYTNAGNNMKARSSNAACGYITEDATLINLPAGLYKVTMMCYANSSVGATQSFAFGDANYDAKISGASNGTTFTKTFVLSGNDDVVWLSEGSNNDDKNGLDYIYIQKLGEAVASVPVTIGETGYITFASTYPLDLTTLPAGVTAYYASEVKDKDEAVALTIAEGQVEVGTGLILAGTGTYNIPVATMGTTIEDNLLVGCTADTPLAKNTQNTNYYVLAKNGETGKAEFQSLAVNGATIPAGKAYLNAPVVTAASARLSIVVGDETTGIAEVASAGTENGVVYNLSGQRVSKPANGLYIVNGKKVIIK